MEIKTYYPKSESVCKGCECVYEGDADGDGETITVFCTCTAPENVRESLCALSLRANTLREQKATLEREIASLEAEAKTVLDDARCDIPEDDGQPDETQEWEDFGERYSEEQGG